MVKITKREVLPDFCEHRDEIKVIRRYDTEWYAVAGHTSRKAVISVDVSVKACRYSVAPHKLKQIIGNKVAENGRKMQIYYYGKTDTFVGLTKLYRFVKTHFESAALSCGNERIINSFVSLKSFFDKPASRAAYDMPVTDVSIVVKKVN